MSAAVPDLCRAQSGRCWGPDVCVCTSEASPDPDSLRILSRARWSCADLSAVDPHLCEELVSQCVGGGGSCGMLGHTLLLSHLQLAPLLGVGGGGHGW